MAKKSLDTSGHILNTVELGYDVMKGLNTLCRYYWGA